MYRNSATNDPITVPKCWKVISTEAHAKFHYCTRYLWKPAFEVKTHSAALGETNLVIPVWIHAYNCKQHVNPCGSSCHHKMTQEFEYKCMRKLCSLLSVEDSTLGLSLIAPGLRLLLCRPVFCLSQIWFRTFRFALLSLLVSKRTKHNSSLSMRYAIQSTMTQQACKTC